MSKKGRQLLRQKISVMKTNTDVFVVFNTMRKNLPKTLDQLIFCKYTLVFSKRSQIETGCLNVISGIF